MLLSGMKIQREIHRRIRKKLDGVDLVSDVDVAVSINVGGARKANPEDSNDRDRGPEARRPPDEQEVDR
jgi:hypothetical protein